MTTRTPARRPSLRAERALVREGFARVAGMDEVGRGALAGPVSVGVVVVDIETPTAPYGIRDSKLLRPTERERLAPLVRRWAPSAVGHASAEEIDAHGILAALRLAGYRALRACGVRPDVVLLDGRHDWLTPPPAMPVQEAFAVGGIVDLAPPPRTDPSAHETPPVVRTLVKADLACSSVAAASVIAKVERDAIMVALATEQPYAEYGWAINKGYAAPGHRAALAAHGPCALHRRSWRLCTGASTGMPANPMGHDGSVNQAVSGTM